MANLVDGTTPLPSIGQTSWGTVLNTALSAVDARFQYSTAANVFMPSNTQFFYLGADRSTISASATNPYGVSPTLTLNNAYLFEYRLRVTNSSTGTITLGWAGTSATQFSARVLTASDNVSGSSTSIVGVDGRNGTANATITGGNSAATWIISITGVVLKGTADGAFPLQVSVSSGALTPKAGSWFRFDRVGLSTGGSTNITVGAVV